MSAVLLAVFDDYAVASQARIELVRDGFPTDRVDLTASCELGRAGLQPARPAHERFLTYFWSVLGPRDAPTHAEHLAQRLDTGAAAITVHPRGTTETTRAMQLLERAGAAELVQHDLDNQALERAAADSDRIPWVRNLWIETTPETDCLYCRLFPPGRS